MRRRRRRNIRWGLALGGVGALLVGLGLWTATRVNHPAVQPDSLSREEASLLRHHVGKSIKVTLPEGRARFVLPDRQKTVAPALKQAAAAVLSQLPKKARNKTVIVTAQSQPAPLGLVTWNADIESLYAQGKRVQQRQLTRELTTTAQGTLRALGI